MFKELGPLLRQRSVVMILTRLEDDAIRVNVIPKKLSESENQALTTPVSVFGTAEELDAQLPSTLSQFVGAHLELKNSLETAKEQMAAAAKAAKTVKPKTAPAPAPANTTSAKTQSAKAGTNKPAGEAATAAESQKPEVRKPEPSRTASLFDFGSSSAPVATASSASAYEDHDEEREILAEIEENDDTTDGADEAA